MVTQRMIAAIIVALQAKLGQAPTRPEIINERTPEMTKLGVAKTLRRLVKSGIVRERRGRYSIIKKKPPKKPRNRGGPGFRFRTRLQRNKVLGSVLPGTRTALQFKRVSDEVLKGAAALFTSENAHRGWWSAFLTMLGLNLFAEVPRADATASKKDVEGDGITSHIKGTVFNVLDTNTVRFEGAKQVGLVQVLQHIATKAILVIGVGHLASGQDGKKETLREKQMRELSTIMDTKAEEYSASTAILLGDCNASPFPVNTEDGKSTIPPLTHNAALSAGFVLQLPPYAHRFGSPEFVTEMATSSKIRIKARDGEAPRKEDKTALNDLVYLKHYNGAPSFRMVSYLMPRKQKNRVYGMQTECSDHSMLYVEIQASDGSLFGVGFWNLLAHGLDDEMKCGLAGSVKPCIAPESMEAARAVVLGQASTPELFHYTTGKSAKILKAPYRFPFTKEQVLGWMNAAYLRDLKEQAELLGITPQEVKASQFRETRNFRGASASAPVPAP